MLMILLKNTTKGLMYIMGNFNYTISIIENNDKIERLNYDSKKAATKVYNAMCIVARYYTNDIYGVLLWQHEKGKTIDNDAYAKIIKHYYK